MNQKQPKPTLTGQRIKTRKRDEKEKYDPLGFRDAIFKGLNEAGNNIELAYKFLDDASSRLDYRRYSETLLDILLAGGILAPGGTIVGDVDKTKPVRSSLCVFTCEEDVDAVRTFSQIFTNLIRRYKYMEKKLEDEMLKILVFLKAFTPSERTKLAMVTGIFLSKGHIPATCLNSLYNEVLVKEGITLEFVLTLFKVWLEEKDINSIAAALRKAQLEKKLMLFLPTTKQTLPHFQQHFSDAGLTAIVEFQRNVQDSDARKELQTSIITMINNGTSTKEIEEVCKEYMAMNKKSEQDIVTLIWKSLMKALDWNKKEELVADQAIRHLKNYSELLGAFTTQAKSEMTLLLKVQDYCYENIPFMKSFHKMVLLFYKTDVLSEEVIIKWYKDAHSAKGKSVFLEQMKKFVEWLENAEEESESEEED
ncbi:Basic leucine zipper and W2 domain-containing protein 1 [Holothuria leucospilota]|uniref:Basic leucine zipper and W2 domain-containing protein 1 n=1 Tax=Holothuria leucospilota TaxID=206669 RepID=A0A9Q1C165_HOLLE|nr:Basic leucine zipper and W2 domain-containing protein 1 [Holothuria leucospilota]